MGPVGSVEDTLGWMERRTWSGRDVDHDAIREALQRRDERVSVVVAALDEEATVGRVVDELVDLVEAGTVHEVLVVDGGSTDRTVERAHEAGARVIDQADAGPAAPPAPGKGDALWKGVANTRGDLVVFVDADVEGFPAWWVPALLAPLCEDDGVHLVKAAYDRVGEGRTGPGGGRVTELVARPLLNLLWPELAGVHQPLAGEYAARREILLQLPFPQGYGVEIGLLLGAAAHHGPDAVAQVLLGERRHTHQPLHALSRMAGEVLHAAAGQLRREGRLDAELAASLLVPGSAPARLRVGERPPLATLQNGGQQAEGPGADRG